MNKKEVEFIIVDGDSLIHRAYHGYKAENGLENTAVKGFTEMLSKIINVYNPRYIAIVFDHQGDCFRHNIYPQYKGGRPPKTQDLIDQIEAINKFTKAMGLPYFCVEGVEGDDVIGVLAEKAKKIKLKTIIFSGDKDLAQLVDENTMILDTKTKKEITINNIKEHFGVNSPSEIVDFLAIKGDKPDNIIGMRDCGEKTALKLIEKYGTIENILKIDLEELYEYVKPIVRQKQKAESIINQIKNEKDTLLLWKKLTSLKLDIPMKMTMKEIKPSIEKIEINIINDIKNKYNLNLNNSIPMIIRKNLSK